jgi:hypothetical protein
MGKRNFIRLEQVADDPEDPLSLIKCDIREETGLTGILQKSPLCTKNFFSRMIGKIKDEHSARTGKRLLSYLLRKNLLCSLE